MTKLFSIKLGRDEPDQVEFELEGSDEESVRQLLKDVVRDEFLHHISVEEAREDT